MNQIAQYFRATLAEMKQVKWPTQNQAMVYTLLVLLICTIVALFVALFDFVFSLGIDTIISNF